MVISSYFPSGMGRKQIINTTNSFGIFSCRSSTGNPPSRKPMFTNGSRVGMSSKATPYLSVQHYLLAGEREQAAGIMDTHARSLYIRGEERVLEDWLQALSSPPDLKQLAPDLVLNWVKVKVNQGKLEGCLELLDLVEPVFIAQGRFENLANLMVVRGMILRFQGDFEKAIDIARRTLALVEEHNLDKYYEYQSERLEGLGLYHTGHQQQASAAFNAALLGFRELIAQQPTDRLKHDLIMVLTDIGMMSLLMGDIFNAQGSFEEALSISLTLRGNKGDLATCANNRAYLSFLVGDFRQAWRYYEQALTAAEQADWTRSIVQVLNGQAELLTIFDEFEKAAAALHRAAEVAQSVPGGQVSPATHLEMAELEKLAGNYTQAMYYLRAAAHAGNLDIQDPGVPGPLWRSLCEHGAVAGGQGDARIRLSRTSPRMKSRASCALLGYYYLAETCFRLGDGKEALEPPAKSVKRSRPARV